MQRPSGGADGTMPLTGLTVLVPGTRDGWEEVGDSFIPVLVGNCIENKTHSLRYYHAESPFLRHRYPHLARKRCHRTSRVHLAKTAEVEPCGGRPRFNVAGIFCSGFSTPGRQVAHNCKGGVR